jgi:hypothetical protein
MNGAAANADCGKCARWPAAPGDSETLPGVTTACCCCCCKLGLRSGTLIIRGLLPTFAAAAAAAAGAAWLDGVLATPWGCPGCAAVLLLLLLLWAIPCAAGACAGVGVLLAVAPGCGAALLLLLLLLVTVCALLLGAGAATTAVCDSELWGAA